MGTFRDFFRSIVLNLQPAGGWQTVARILEKANALPDLADTLETVKANDVLELDALWSFVFRKSDKRWIWIALCQRTRQILAYFIRDRSEQSCRELWKRIPASYK